MQDLDPLLIWPILLGFLFTIPWALAFFKFPKVINKIMKDVEVGPFKQHLLDTAGWVKDSAHSHWLVMNLKDLAMLAMMYLHFNGVYEIGVGIMWILLIPFLYWGLNAYFAIARLEKDSEKINKVIKHFEGFF